MNRPSCMSCAWCVACDSLYFPYECWNPDPAATGCFPDSAYLCYAFAPFEPGLMDRTWTQMRILWEERYGIVSKI